MLTDEQRRALVEALESDGVVCGPVWELYSLGLCTKAHAQGGWSMRLTEHSRLLAEEIRRSSRLHAEVNRTLGSLQKAHKEIDTLREQLIELRVLLEEIHSLHPGGSR